MDTLLLMIQNTPALKVYKMPWNPEHYSVKPKKLLPLTDSPLTHIPSIGFVRQPGITESPTHSEEMQDELEPIEDDWWERHKSYIEHRKEFPYYPEKNKK